MPYEFNLDLNSIDGELVAVGGDLEPETLISAYRNGIFPWPHEKEFGKLIPWFSPDPRAVLFFKDLHIPRSLRKDFQKKQNDYLFTFNQNFKAVIENCRTIKRRGQNFSTWITLDMVNAYLKLHELGYAHSVEVWKKEDNFLVGGLYGVLVDGVFSGESMFSLETNVSKFAILVLIEKLKSFGIEWIDLQQMSHHFEILGAKEIPRKEYIELLKKSQNPNLKITF
jgi:leucyl/phenylalanyl-tRNA--protein transferase